MLRRTLPPLALGILCFAVAVTTHPVEIRAADTPAPTATPTEAQVKELGNKQEFLSRQWKEFSKNLLLIAQKLQKSPRPEDQEKAKNLFKVLELAEKEGVENKFTLLVRTLNTKGNSDFNDFNIATAKNEELIKVLDQILAMLLNDDDLGRIQEERKRLEAYLKELKAILGDQKIARAITETNKADKDQLAKEQKDLANRTDNLAKQMSGEKNKPSPPKDGKDGKSGDPKDGKSGEPKDGKSGEPKDGKSGDGKSGPPMPPKPPMSGNPSEGSPKQGPPPAPGAEQIKKAIPDQENASQQIEKKKNEDAAKKQDDAITKLEEAKKELEKKLKQLREEELERLLANLEARISRMLAMQKEVKANTVALDGIASKAPDKKLPKGDYQRAQQQSDRENEIIAEADKTLQLLQAEGTVVAFPGVLEEVRKDMVRVKERLYAGIVSEDTIAIEQDVIDALTEMMEALKKAQQDLKSGGGGAGGQGGPPPEQKLLDELAELKMIRQLQESVNKKTKRYADKYQGEQADDPLIRADLKDLSGKQDKIEQMVKDMKEGRNK